MAYAHNYDNRPPIYRWERLFKRFPKNEAKNEPHMLRSLEDAVTLVQQQYPHNTRTLVVKLGSPE